MSLQPTIVKITGTFGSEVQNGVGRFLAGLHEWSQKQQLPLHVFSCGDHIRRYPNVRHMGGMAFKVKGFEAIEAYYPLEGRRKQLSRAIKGINPHIIHLSTPEALGITGLGIGLRQHRLITGIYHSDFPAFAERLVRNSLQNLIEERGSLGFAGEHLGPLWQQLEPHYHAATQVWERWLIGWLLKRILRRNQSRIDAELRRQCDSIARWVEVLVREAMTQFYSHMHLVITRSDVYRQKLIDELYLKEHQVRTLKCGVDSQRFSPQRTEADPILRKRLGIAPDEKVILYVGRITPEKNVGFLAEAWRRLQAENPHEKWRFVLVGSGALPWIQEKAGPKAMTVGPLHGEELSAAYRLGDLFWSASDSETLGQVVLESLASGIPTLVSDRGASRENILEGRTGRILKLDDPQRWAQAAQTLLHDDPMRQTMAREARLFAERHTIENSYQHYWELHRQLYETGMSPSFQPRRGYLLPNVRDAIAVPPTIPRTTHLSDFHSGERSRRIPKEAAFRAVCERIRDRQSTLFLHGDFLDTRPAMHKFKSDLDMVRNTLDEYQIRPELYFEGNHDYEFARKGQIAEMIGCPVCPTLIHRDDRSGLVLTHGHVSELPGIQQLLKTVRNCRELLAQLSIAQLEDALKISALNYDVIGVLTNFVERAGLEGLEDAWRHAYDGRRWLADRLMDIVRNHSLDDRGIKAIIHMIGSSDREEVLSQLCAGLDGWGVIYGHTHEPHVTKQKVIHPFSGEERTVLLGNSGSFRRKSIPPTWIEGAFPHLELWAYNIADESAERIDRVSLTEEEMAPYLREFPQFRVQTQQELIDAAA